MAQEQPANQQQQQQQSQHLQNSKYNTLDHYTSIPVNSQVSTLKRDNGHLNIPMDDVFMPRDDPIDVSDEFDRELEAVGKPLDWRLDFVYSWKCHT